MRSVSVIQLNLSVATCLRMVHDISFVSGYDICWVFARLCAVSKQKQEQCALWEESISEKYILHYECIFYIISDFLIGFARWFALFCALFFFVPTSSPCRPFEVTVLFERDYIDLSIFSLSLDPAVTAYGRLRFLTKISAVVPAIIFYRCSYDYDGKSQRYHTDLALIFINPDWNFIARNSSSWKDCECSFLDSIS